MRLMVVTILMLGGATLAMEYALLDVKKRSETGPAREEGLVYVRDDRGGRPAGGDRSVAEAGGADPTGLVASLVEQYPGDRRRVARKLARIATPSAVDALVNLCRGEEDAVQRELILGALARFPRGRDGIRRLAEDGRFMGAARARQILDAAADDR